MKTKKLLALGMVAAMSLAAFTACGGSESSSSEEVKEASTGVAPGEDAGFTELPIGDDQQVEWLNIAAVYFQPVDMEGQTNYSAEDYDIHIEADISAAQNDIGFGTGDWVPYLTVDYDVIGSDGKSAANGTFMVMNASDGPHYGANIKLDKADTYTFQLTIHSPIENGFLLHVDEETGVTGRFWNDPLVVTFEGWDYVPQEW